MDSCSFIANTVSANGGGAIYNETNTNVVINNSTFMQNSTAAGRYGAAILNSTSSNTTIFKCHFVNNNAGFGGAIHNNSCSPVIDSCSFENNLATINGGAISIYGSTSMPQISGSTFIKNKATGNGGFQNTGIAGCDVYLRDDGGQTWKKTHDNYIKNFH